MSAAPAPQAAAPEHRGDALPALAVLVMAAFSLGACVGDRTRVAIAVELPDTSAGASDTSIDTAGADLEAHDATEAPADSVEMSETAPAEVADADAETAPDVDDAEVSDDVGAEEVLVLQPDTEEHSCTRSEDCSATAFPCERPSCVDGICGAEVIAGTNGLEGAWYFVELRWDRALGAWLGARGNASLSASQQWLTDATSVDVSGAAMPRIAAGSWCGLPSGEVELALDRTESLVSYYGATAPTGRLFAAASRAAPEILFALRPPGGASKAMFQSHRYRAIGLVPHGGALVSVAGWLDLDSNAEVKAGSGWAMSDGTREAFVANGGSRVDVTGGTIATVALFVDGGEEVVKRHVLRGAVSNDGTFGLFSVEDAGGMLAGVVILLRESEASTFIYDAVYATVGLEAGATPETTWGSLEYPGSPGDIGAVERTSSSGAHLALGGCDPCPGWYLIHTMSDAGGGGYYKQQVLELAGARQRVGQVGYLPAGDDAGGVPLIVTLPTTDTAVVANPTRPGIELLLRRTP